ncbi:MAG: hypothetical protein IPI17_03310 [Nitrosomonas sp.]|jgi:hypothetical protein|nr:hypothetical protein [Nitrosomonas sp.]
MSELPNNGWQPMDTAPKDRRILLIMDGEMYVGHWVQDFITGYESYSIGTLPDGMKVLIDVAPEAWHELPELPELLVQ